MDMYRQGRLLLIPVDETPPGQEAPREDDGRLVLCYDHEEPMCVIVGGGATLILDEHREWYLTVTSPEGVDLVHPARATLRVQPGNYRVGFQHGFQY